MEALEVIGGLIIAPLIVFMIIVAPIWLILHYRSKRQIKQGLGDEDIALLEEMVRKADKMAERIDTLERILDTQQPEWRSHR